MSEYTSLETNTGPDVLANLEELRRRTRRDADLYTALAAAVGAALLVTAALGGAGADPLVQAAVGGLLMTAVAVFARVRWARTEERYGVGYPSFASGLIVGAPVGTVVGVLATGGEPPAVALSLAVAALEVLGGLALWGRARAFAIAALAAGVIHAAATLLAPDSLTPRRAGLGVALIIFAAVTRWRQSRVR